MELVLTFVLLLSVVLVPVHGQDCLGEHNKYRARHGSPPLRAHRTLEQYAMKRANDMARTDNFSHPRGSRFGENLYYSTGRTSCTPAIRMWYNENRMYNYNRGSFSSRTGHFTQVVWKGSQYLGCASAKSRRTRRVYVVCNYYPAGNMRGRFRENVKRG